MNLSFNAVLLLVNGYTYWVNRKGSQFTFVSQIIIVFIICDLANLPLQLSDFYIIRADQQAGGSFPYIFQWVWINAVSEFTVIFSFCYAHWQFTLMYYRISSRLKNSQPDERRSSYLTRTASEAKKRNSIRTSRNLQDCLLQTTNFCLCLT